MIRSGEWLDIRAMYEDGVSISEIARRTGHDRKTVRKVLSWEGPIPRARKGYKRGSLLDPYKDYVIKRMDDGLLNACVILREIKDRGYHGGITILRDFMRPFKPPLRHKAVMRFETPPGEQIQLDFGVFPYLDERGVHRRVYCFAMVLGYSRMITLEFLENASRPSILRAMKHGLEFFGGTTRHLLSDNMKQLQDDRDSSGVPVWSDEYVAMAEHYGFTPKACRPYAPQTKGKIERPIGYIKGNFWAGLSFWSLSDLNHKAAVWRDTVANVRVHGTTHEVPLERYALEKPLLIPLNPRPYAIERVEPRTISRDAFVVWDTNRYPVPWEYAGESALVRESESGTIAVEVRGEVVASFPVMSGRNRVLRVEEHHRGIPPSGAAKHKKPVARLLSAPQVEERPLCVYQSLLEVSSGWKEH